jgi:hypothetical protein
MSAPSRIPSWTAYGDGVYVRSLLISTTEPGTVSLAMEDIVHAFQIRMTHGDGVIRGIDARWDRDRHPLSSCAGAGLALESLVGCSLASDLFSLGRQADSRQHCTHMFDMLCLAAQHACLGLEDRRYDVVVPDAPGARAVATLYLNGRSVLEFEFDDDLRLTRPEPCAGLSALKGFMGWVRDHVPPADQTLYFVMQKALFVSRAQKVDLASMGGLAGTLSGPPPGSCFGSQSPRFEVSIRTHSLRRFDRSNFHDVLAFHSPR